MFVSLCVCLCVCVHDNTKNDGSINLKFGHIIVYQNCSYEFTFDIVCSRSRSLHDFETSLKFLHLIFGTG